MASLRVLLVGGFMSYRALFTWLSPRVLIPTLLVTPLFQILFFASVGRRAGIGSDAFFLIGNALQYAAAPCLFGIGNTIVGERHQATLALLLASPARRVPLFLGRALPTVLNGGAVSLFALLVGAVLLRVALPPESWLPLVLVTGICAFACTGLGLMNAAVGLLAREVNVLANVIFGVLLMFSSVNVPMSSMPAWMVHVAGWLPFTHGIQAARQLSVGATIADIRGNLLAEAGLGVLYTVVGLVLLRYLERDSRRRATLETA